MSYPKKVQLREDGPREGFQILKNVVPTKDKLKLIDSLSNAGAKSIEVTSFVRPDKVPQHADALEVAEGLNPVDGVRYRGLYLNEKGFERAVSCSKIQPEGCLTIASSEEFLKKNSNSTIQGVIDKISNWIELFQKNQIQLERLMVSCAFGDNLSGKILPEQTLEVVRRVISALDDIGEQLPEVTFADTTGYADPEQIRQIIDKSQTFWPEIDIALHLHDTRGTGMANVLAGLQAGIDKFDCSVGGMGGCPFTIGAAGNVPTEDVAFLCMELGVEVDLNLEAYIQTAKLAEEITGVKLPGKVKDGGLILRK